MVAAYSKLAVDEVFFVIWLIKIRKRSSLNTVPHGMPDVTSDLEECFPSSTPFDSAIFSHIYNNYHI
jgi:hypothetical protein